MVNFVSTAHGSSSCIDHILFPSLFRNQFEKCYVLEDAPLDVFDHLPVVARFSILSKSVCSVRNPPSADIRFCPNWRRAPPFSYKFSECTPFSYKFSEILFFVFHLTWDRPSNDFIISRISETPFLAASGTLPSIKFCKHVRPGWNGDFKQATFAASKLIGNCVGLVVPLTPLTNVASSVRSRGKSLGAYSAISNARNLTFS